MMARMHPRRSLLTAFAGGLGGCLLGGAACSSATSDLPETPTDRPDGSPGAAGSGGAPDAATDGEVLDASMAEEATPGDAMAADGDGGDGPEEADAPEHDAPPCEASAEPPPCQGAPPGLQVGPIQDFFSLGLHPFQAEQFLESLLVGRDCGGIYALSAVCPHMGCTLALPELISEEGVKCGCHGSSFDLLGQVTKGPAKKNLVPFAVALGCDGLLYVNRNAPVDRGQRLVVKGAP